MEIQILVYSPSGKTENAVLTWSEIGAEIRLANNIRIQTASHEEDLEFSLRYEIKGIPVSTGEKVRLKSYAKIRKLSEASLGQYEMYPPSSDGWITMLSNSGKDVVMIIHELAGSDKLLMIIIDRDNGELITSHKIQSFETGILRLETDYDAYRKLFTEYDSTNREKLLAAILDTPPPSWNELANLVEGVSVPNLRIGETMRETMNQLVPKSFPETIREELMAFLSLIISIRIPKADPLEYNTQYRSTPLLHSLLFHHIQSLIEGDNPPQYVKIFAMADRKVLPDRIQPTAESIEKNPWDIAWYKLTNMFPNRRGRIIDIISKLSTGTISSAGLPITREDARDSKEAWIDRFALILYSLQLRAHVNNQKLGLKTLIYIGGAHRWPHEHLFYSARLGNPTEKPPYLQLMIMPPVAAERILRLRSNIMDVEWSKSLINYDLFSNKTLSWRVHTSRIIESINGQKTLKNLKQEFDTIRSDKIKAPSKIESKVLGFISWGFYLNSLELGQYDRHLGIDKESLLVILNDFSENGIIDLQYYLPMAGLASLCLVCDGPSQNVQSLTRAFLKHTPSTTANIADSGKRSYILARIPESSVFDIFTRLPERAQANEMQVKIYRVNAYAAYTHNFYERILRDDLSWNDDISGFMSQLRS